MNNEQPSVTIPAECVPHVEAACGELEQLIRLLGTMQVDNDSDMAIRGIAVRMSQLHNLVFGSIIGHVEPAEAMATLRGPAQWFNPA